tara:strand:- start:813 stop:1232 length:420 start_codon:yes stop_codon:yes gene_type:complete
MDEYAISILFLLFLIFLFINFSKSYYIKKSDVDGLGLFSNKDYKKNDIIINDLFPYNNKRNIIKKISGKDFNDFIIHEGKYVNHCSRRYNTDIITDDNIYFKLIATKDISKDKEITANYDLINRKFPFIAKSQKHFKKC